MAAIREKLVGDILPAIAGAAKYTAESGLLLAGLLDARKWRSQRVGAVKRVAFQAFSIHLAQVFRTTITRLMENAAVEVSFIVLPHPQISWRGLADVAHYVKSELGVPAARVQYPWQVVWERFDLIICTDVYAMFPLRKTRTCLIPHGAGLPDRFVQRRRGRKTAFDFDIVAANGPYDCSVLQSSAKGRKLPRVIAIGFPFLDPLFAAAEPREAFCAKYGFAPERRIVVYAPHWEALNVHGAVEQFSLVIEAMRCAGVNVLIKPHACSLNPRMSRNIDWHAHFMRFSDSPGVGVDFDCDDVPALHQADALVTDRSSRAFNAMLVGVPVILLDNAAADTTPLAAARMQLMRDGSHRAQTPADITRLLLTPSLLRSRSVAAQHVARQCFASPGRATEAFLALIGEEFGLRAMSGIDAGECAA